MGPMHERIVVALEEAVSEHVGIGAASGIRPSYVQDIAATIRAACDACATGTWAPPEIKSAAKIMAARREAQRAEACEAAAATAAKAKPAPGPAAYR